MQIRFNHGRKVVTGVFSDRIRNLGKTTVEPPPWLDEARVEAE